METVRAGYLVRATLRELKEMGGSARPKDILDRVEPKLTLTDYEKAS